MRKCDHTRLLNHLVEGEIENICADQSLYNNNLLRCGVFCKIVIRILHILNDD